MLKRSVSAGIAILPLFAYVGLSACASSGKGDSIGSGGNSSTGGSAEGGSSAGGSADTGGNASEGGSVGTGGLTGTGGAPLTGGKVGSGGTGGASAGTGGTVAGTGGAAGSPAAILPVPQTCSGGIPDSVAPPPAWKNVTGSLARMPSECGNLTMLSANPCTGQVVAGVAKVGMYSTIDGGTTWNKLGSGAGSANITNRTSSIVYDPLDANIFYESGIYNGGGVYKTIDAGTTFKQLGTINHNDLISIDFSDPARTTMLAGGHEQKQKLFLSTNGGASFTDIGAKMPADSHFSTAPLVLNASTFLVGECGYGAGKCGVYRSTDAGATWTRTTDIAATARPLWARDGAIYWPLIYDNGLIKSTNQGATWSKVGAGLVTTPPIELPDGRIVSLNRNNLQITADGGKTWKAIGAAFPFQPSGAVYSAALKTFFIWHWDCGGIVLADAIASAGWDYKTQ